MPEYRAPGIYVEEVPSAIRPIAGVSTSTAGFIGVVPDKLPQITKVPEGTVEAPTKWVERTVPAQANTARLITNWTQFTAAFGDLVGDPETAAANGSAEKAVATGHRNLAHAVYGFFNNGGSRCFVVRIADESHLDAGLKALAAIDEIAVVVAPGVTSPTMLGKIADDCRKAERFAILDGPKSAADLTSLTTAAATGRTPEAPVDQTAKYGVAIATTVPLESAPAYDNGQDEVGASLTAASAGALTIDGTAVKKGDRVLVKDQAEAAENGIYTLATTGTAAARYVLTRATDFEKSADIAAGAIVSVDKGEANKAKQFKLDPAKTIAVGTDAVTFVTYEPAAKPPAHKASASMPQRTDCAAWYFPWIKVFDPATKLQSPAGDGSLGVPPSGHLAGIYARVDAERGVHKAPANEVMLGALGVRYTISKPSRTASTRSASTASGRSTAIFSVWGARTVGGDANADLKYVNVRRTLLFLRKSIEQGTQWVVFEPNSPALWQQITRNVTAFLTTVWRSGALFGTTRGGGVLRQVRRRDQPARTARSGPGRDRDRRRHRAAGRVRHLPHQPVQRVRRVAVSWPSPAKAPACGARRSSSSRGCGWRRAFPASSALPTARRKAQPGLPFALHRKDRAGRQFHLPGRWLSRPCRGRVLRQWWRALLRRGQRRAPGQRARGRDRRAGTGGRSRPGRGPRCDGAGATSPMFVRACGCRATPSPTARCRATASPSSMPCAAAMSTG